MQLTAATPPPPPTPSPTVKQQQPKPPPVISRKFRQRTPPPLQSSASSIWRARELTSSSRAPLPQRLLPNPPPLRDGARSAALSRNSRQQTKDALARLVTVANALAPGGNTPNRFVSQPATLDWVASRLDIFADDLRRNKKIVVQQPDNNVDGPAPWPAVPEQSEGSPAVGAVAERARQIEALLADPKSIRRVKDNHPGLVSVKKRARQIEALLNDSSDYQAVDENVLDEYHSSSASKPVFAPTRPLYEPAPLNRKSSHRLSNDMVHSKVTVPKSNGLHDEYMGLNQPEPISQEIHNPSSQITAPAISVHIKDGSYDEDNMMNAILLENSTRNIPSSPLLIATDLEPPSSPHSDIPGPSRIIRAKTQFFSENGDEFNDEKSDSNDIGEPFLRLTSNLARDTNTISPNSEPLFSEGDEIHLRVESDEQAMEVKSSIGSIRKSGSTSSGTASMPVPPNIPQSPKSYAPLLSSTSRGGGTPKSLSPKLKSPLPPPSGMHPATGMTPPLGPISPTFSDNGIRYRENNTQAARTAVPPVAVNSGPMPKSYNPLLAKSPLGGVISTKSSQEAPFSSSSRAVNSSLSLLSPPGLKLRSQPVLSQIAPPPSLGIRIPSETSLPDSPEHAMPRVPSNLDLPIGSWRSRDNSSATMRDREASFLSRGSTGRAQLHADYDKIYNRTSDELPAGSESQIEVAAGELFVLGAVQDRWHFGDKIGEGGFSEVYKGIRKDHPRYEVDDDIPRNVAIKVITKRPEAFNRRMVEREVFSFRLMEMVDGHESIVKLYEVSEDELSVYLVMELLEGGELFMSIAERGQYTEQDAANLVVSMLAALCFCHRFNLTHRDVKPENFVFLKNGKTFGDAELKLTDFGIAHYSEDPEAVCRTMCGTLLYIAPEVLFRQPYGAEADLWSLGVITYIMLVGYPPFHDVDMVQLVKKIKYKPVSFKGPQWSLISEEGKEFLENLLDKDKSNRMTARQALEHKWLVNNCQAASRNVLETAQANIKSFTTRKRWQSAVSGVKVVNKLSKAVAENTSQTKGESGTSTFTENSIIEAGNFTVATEDTANEPEVGSLWARIKMDKIGSKLSKAASVNVTQAKRDTATKTRSYPTIIDEGNFTVATEDTAAEPEVGSLWARIRKESRMFQARRLRSHRAAGW